MKGVIPAVYPLRHSRGLPTPSFPQSFRRESSLFVCMIYLKSGSLLLKNPVCLYPGGLHGSQSPTTKLEDDATSGMTGG